MQVRHFKLPPTVTLPTLERKYRGNLSCIRPGGLARDHADVHEYFRFHFGGTVKFADGAFLGPKGNARPQSICEEGTFVDVGIRE